MPRKISQADIDHWHQHGYVIVKNFLSEEELVAARKNLRQYLPDWDEYVERAPLFNNMTGGSMRSAPGWLRHEFPYVGDALNHVALHPFLIGFVERLVGHDNLALSHGAIVGKYAGRADYDQLLHEDYTNNTLAFPSTSTGLVDVPMIVYYTDVTPDLGPTYVVSMERTAGMPPTGRRFYSREEYPDLYAAEVPATMPAGSALIYSMRTVHRGSAMRAAEGLRFSQFVAFHTAGPRWLGSDSFQRLGDLPEMRRLITRATPRQRQLIGFPAPGDAYWTEDTLAGVAARYPGMDMTPYKERA
ncbi:MAG TPA: phytanoyl-CoA dioxygenase family protein [Acidimicrobiales bacterium]|nr:phytanoyl-CoA dioxygenase family protein [Acidimicrobiales bacterium]